MMATPIMIPEMGSSVDSCLICEWKVKPGDQVRKGDPLCEIETGKALMDIEAPVDGLLLEIFVHEGDVVPDSTIIAVIGQKDESYEHLIPQISMPDAVYPSDLSQKRPEPEKQDESSHENQNGDLPQHTGISPRASRLARELGISSSGIRGTGPGGRIIERDIRSQALDSKKIVSSPTLRHSTGKHKTTNSNIIGDQNAGLLKENSDQVIEIPIRGIRKVVGEKMLYSLQTTAQLTLHASANVSTLLALRKKLKAERKDSNKPQLTINDFILFTISRLLLKHPKLNSHFLEEKIIQYKYVNISCAIDTPRGLIAPVIKDAHKMSIYEISENVEIYKSSCRKGNIQPDDLRDGTFTVTNLGALGIEQFTPILNPPQVGILGIGNIQPRAVYKEKKIQYFPHMSLSLTLDHQAIDGSDGARFLKDLTEMISEIGPLYPEN